MFNSTARGSDGQPTSSQGSAAAGSRPGDREALLAQLAQSLVSVTRERVSAELRSGKTAPEVARAIGDIVGSHFRAGGVSLSVIELRENVARCIAASRGAAGQPAASGSPGNPASDPGGQAAPDARRGNAPPGVLPPEAGSGSGFATAGQRQIERFQSSLRPDQAGVPGRAQRSKVDQAKKALQPLLLRRMDIAAAASLPRQELERQLDELLRELVVEAKVQLNRNEQANLLNQLLDDMLGLGPLEPLVLDDGVTDIMVNGPKQVYIERHGKLELTEVQFDDNQHVLNICNRIVSRVGRRVDESSPICDARLLDGSRVNIIIPPLAIDGPSISIRKFGKRKITFNQMVQQNNCSAAMATVLRIASRSRLNILVSGGTGSGKTTLLNALSGMVDNGERVVTIEDAAELRLQQPHVVRLETRPPNLEGQGEVTMRDLVKNALRMRPDRIILGEVRGGEAVDLLQAMNTGHDGSMGTVHANRPREALTRLENMMSMANLNLPSRALRQQIAASLQMIVQIQRMRDGLRRITHITEVIGMEGEVITTQDLFVYEFQGESADGRLVGTFKSTGLRPAFLPKAAYFNLDRALVEAMV
jgi:pilus assembly protein CpaF